MSRWVAFGCCLLIGCAGLRRGPPPKPGASPPRLAVLVSVDQLRADMPRRLLDRYGKGGFARFFAQGVSYESGAYAHSATETAVGHATLSTGALPKDHGIVGNEWSERGARVYSVDDYTQPLLGASGHGKSPHKLLAETIGEVLVEAHPSALVRGVAGKERASVLMTGRKGVAYWLDNGAGSFVTSRFYAVTAPGWVSAFAADRPAEEYRTEPWKLLQSPARYVAADDHAWELRGAGVLGNVFPHDFGEATGARLVHALKSTPFGDTLTLRFVDRMLAKEPLGRDDVPDLLTIGLSSTDYVGHAFGPESREAEDNLLRLDRLLADLFALLDARVGLDRYFVVLSADHGSCESPEHFAAQGLDAGRIDPAALRAQVDAGLRVRFGIGVELVRDFVNPSLVLDEQRIASLSLSLPEVERAAAEIVKSAPGVETAYARTDLLAKHPPTGRFVERIVRSTHPERSGNVYVVPREHWLLATEPEHLTAMHGTPYACDAAVPIMVWGTRAMPQLVRRAVDPRDIAPTIASLLQLRPPRESTGKPLKEAIDPGPSAPQTQAPK
ncbi:MAG: alkaline phosphatase family protein [Polyangiales bacterium]